jgi:hypothetical protein
MRIGNWLGGSVLMALVTINGMAATARTAEQSKTVPLSLPLGGSLDGQSGDRYYGVYVPTRFGGVLQIKTTEGTIVELKRPNGTPLTNGQDTGFDQQGWYTFKVEGAKKTYSVSDTFVQVGESTKKPWNFYYWPTKGDSIHEPWAGGNARVDTMNVSPGSDDQLIAAPGGYIPPGIDIVLPGPNGLLETLPQAGDDATWFPNIYDDLTWVGPDKNNGGVITRFLTPSPLLKYDQLFGTSARQWEAAFSQNKDISRWPGHCLGGAVASILLNEPTPAPWTGMTRDELKALWAELGENHFNHRIGDYANEIPPGPPRPGYDPCDWKAPRVHAMLETHIRGEKKALLANLRAFPPRGTINEVWNHGVYKYIATYRSVPGRGLRAVKISVELHANSGSMINGQDDKDRVINYEYVLVYGLDGKIDESNPALADWISVGGEALFAPLNVLELVESHWAGHNQNVTEANVRSLDLANGGANQNRRLAQAPQFRSVLEYEAGRARMIAAETGNSGSPRVGGFFSRIFGGGR